MEVTASVCPSIENAPGLSWLPRKKGYEAKWRATREAVRAGFEPFREKLWTGWELPADERERIAARCRELQAAMVAFTAASRPTKPIEWDGCIHSLIDAFLYDPISDYHTKRFVTRQNYDTLCKRLLEDRGSVVIADIKFRTLKEWQLEWTQSGVTMAHSLMTMLGILLSFGMTVLERDECAKVAMLKSKLRVKNGKPRKTIMTYPQVVALIAESHRVGLHSIALAQAFQFAGTFRQKDIIGERVPIDDIAEGYLIDGNEKWLRGILWEEIDDKFILHHVTSKKEKLSEPPLLFDPNLVRELNRAYPGCVTQEIDEDASQKAGKVIKRFVPHRDRLPASGPIIISELTGKPWKTVTFRRRWRKIADAVGIPKEVKEMDYRASAITEATNAGVSLEIAAKAAGHSHTSQTSNYSRDDQLKHGMAMQGRAATRPEIEFDAAA